MEASNATGDESSSQTSSQLFVRPIRLAGGKEENKTEDDKLRPFVHGIIRGKSINDFQGANI